jgi:hypothetical protein
MTPYLTLGYIQIAAALQKVLKFMYNDNVQEDICRDSGSRPRNSLQINWLMYRWESIPQRVKPFY